MTHHRPAVAALIATAAALAAAARPAWALRALCMLAGPHAYVWHQPPDGPPHLACIGCRTRPRLLSALEPARAGCHGCVDCVCKAPTWRPPADTGAAGREGKTKGRHP